MPYDIYGVSVSVLVHVFDVNWLVSFLLCLQIFKKMYRKSVK